MSNFNQEMTRWTSPTNPAFYALHKNAIGLYHTAAVIVQILWLIFSTKPLTNILVQYVPFLSTYAVAVAVAVLIFIHYIVYELVRYVFYNWLDNNPNTNSSIGTVGSLVILLAGLLALDVAGVTSLIRDESKFTTLHTQNEIQGSTAAQKRLDVFNADLAVINSAFDNEITAINTAYSAKIAKRQRQKDYDDDDRAKKKRDIAALKTERDDAIGIKKTELATAQKQLVTAKNRDIDAINNKHNDIMSKIETADADNEAKSHAYGWIISVFCLLTLLFCTYQSTILRVKSGQQPVSRYTIADATGSTTTKFFDVMEDAWQRQSHRFLVWLHAVATTGTQELDEIDGAFILKKKGAQAKTSVMPGDDKDLLGGTGGGGSKPPTPPAPTAPAQPLGGESALKSNRMYRKALADATTDLGEGASEMAITQLADAYFTKMQATPSVQPELQAIESSVTTDKKTVTTDKSDTFSYWDKLIKDFKSDFQKELNNLKIGNGTEKSIMNRIIKTQKDFDLMIRESKATPKLKTEICNWVLDNVSPLVSAYIAKRKEGSEL